MNISHSSAIRKKPLKFGRNVKYTSYYVKYAKKNTHLKAACHKLLVVALKKGLKKLSTLWEAGTTLCSRWSKHMKRKEQQRSGRRLSFHVSAVERLRAQQREYFLTGTSAAVAAAAAVQPETDCSLGVSQIRADIGFRSQEDVGEQVGQVTFALLLIQTRLKFLKRSLACGMQSWSAWKSSLHWYVLCCVLESSWTYFCCTGCCWFI